MTQQAVTHSPNAPLHIKLAFARREDVVSDAATKTGLRIPTRFAADRPGESTESHWCQAIDLSDQPISAGLSEVGFAQIELAGLPDLQAELSAVRAAGKLSAATAKAIRGHIQGQTFRLTDGRRLKVLFVAPEGFIMRSAGPNGLDVAPDETMTEHNGHRAADRVHGDQNVYGTPLKQMLKGIAPWLFRHQTGQRANRFSPVHLLNLWIPLQQSTQPLALADRRTVDSATQQVRYALPTDGFLERDAQTQLNDIWLFLHDPNQHWYCDTAMDSGKAYVFDTLGEPHGAATLPGESVAEKYYRRLQALVHAITLGCPSEIGSILDEPLLEEPANTPPTLRSNIQAIRSLIMEAEQSGPDEFAEKDWKARSEAALDRLVRKSLEMRAVAVVF